MFLPTVSATPSGPSSISIVVLNPSGSLTAGIGWRAIHNEDFNAGIGAALFVGMMPMGCSDCGYTAAAAAGLAPHAFASWNLTPSFALTARAQVAIGLLPLFTRGQPFAIALFALEPTLRVGR